jgi:flavin reductase (DIM6/NTAB) family NADH-FMN oxidoreductase RutF
LFIGEIVATYYDEQYITNGVVDFSKVQPLLFVMNDTSYWTIGKQFAKAWNIGKGLILPESPKNR